MMDEEDFSFMSHKTIEIVTFISILLEYFDKNNIKADTENLKMHVKKLANGELVLPDFSINNIHTSNCKNIAEHIIRCGKDVRDNMKKSEKIRKRIANLEKELPMSPFERETILKEWRSDLVK